MKTHSTYQITQYTTPTQLECLKEEWNVLLQMNRSIPIFLTWEWVQSWIKYLGKDCQLRVLAVRNEDDALIGIAPLMQQIYSKSIFHLKFISYLGIGDVCPTDLCFMAHPSDSEGVYRAILDHLRQQHKGWDFLRIPSVYMDTREYQILREYGGQLRVQGEVPCLNVALPSTWEVYESTIKKKLRRKIKSSYAKLQEDYPGLVHFMTLTTLEEVETAMDRMYSLILSRCRSKNLKTAWANQDFADFQKEITRIMFERGWLRMYTLSIADKIIAVDYDFLFNHRIYKYNTGFDFDYAKYCPGHLLLAYDIQCAITEGVRELSFGRGNAMYKYMWSSQEQVEFEILLGNTWKGKLWISIGNTSRILKQKVMRDVNEQKEIRQPGNP